MIGSVLTQALTLSPAHLIKIDSQMQPGLMKVTVCWNQLVLGGSLPFAIIAA